MATDKYDLYTIDYSIQGWDTIMTTDMEKLDDVIHSRIEATLGETVVLQNALYLDSDGKYYKALSDGTKQPTLGLAIETGILDDTIRIQRIGPVTNTGWSWSTKGALLYLSTTVAGSLTESEPSDNIQIVGTVLSPTSIFINVDLTTTSSGEGGGGTSNHSELNELAYADSGHTGFSESSHTHDDRYYTETEVDTISGSLNTKIDEKSSTFIELSDTPNAYDDNKYARSTTSGIEWATVSGNGSSNHSELSSLAYADSGHIGFSPTSHTNTSDNITVDTINTPTYDDIQDWINNTQSAGRMSGGDTSAHTDAITAVTVGGAGSGEFKVAGDLTAYFTVGLSIQVDESTNNDGYYTVASGVAHGGGTTTIPVDEAVATVADGVIYNGKVDVATGTGFVKTTDSDIGSTVSFDLHADTNIALTDLETNYLYVDYNAGTPDIKVTTDLYSIEKNKQFPLSMLYRNGPRTWICNCGLYLPNYTRLNHERLLNTRGYERASGGEISEYGTRNIQSTSGVFYRGSTRVDTTAKASVDDKLTTVYYDGSAWVWTEEETQIDNTYYNNIATGLVELTPSRYAVHWICIDYLSNLYVVYGRGDYTLTQAQLAGVPSLMPVVATVFGIIAAKVIIQKGDTSFDELISAYTQLIPSATPATHNALSGLNDGDYKHLTATNHTDLTDSGDTTLHKHDTLYYTEAEVDSLVPDTILELSDTPAAYDDNKYLRSTTSGTEWATVSGGEGTDHAELANLDYASAGHTGQLALGENDIKLDSLLSADGKYSGITRDGVLGATLAYGDLVYLNTTDQRWELADADAEATSGDVDLAIVLAGGDDGDTRLLLIDGYIREDDWNFTSYGQALFISTTAGDMTQTTVSGSGDIVRVVGKAGTTADQILFNPSQTWIEIS